MNTLRTILIIVQHEILTLLREKTFMLLLGIFFAMTFFSVYIGWSTRTTTTQIYNTTVSYLVHTGVTQVPPNPLVGVSPLAMFNNMVIYILLIGALLAIVIGHHSFVRERKSGVLPLIFVRPTRRATYISAKMLGIVVVLTCIMAGTLAVSVGSALLIPALHLSLMEVWHLFGLYAVSLIYLCLFAVVGLFFAIRAANESTALFIPIMLWVAAVFILPELTTGQNPVALLNPITLASAVPSQGAFFALAHQILGPFSVGQFYTQGALGMLSVVATSFIVPIIALLVYVGIFLGASAYAVNQYVSTQDILV